MKVLVLGAGGMAGHVIAVKLSELGYNVDCLARRKLSFCDNIIADVCDIESLKKIIISGSYNAVINAVGILPKDINQNQYNGIWINSCLPHYLAKITENSPTRIIHLSTDCVFSGHDGGRYDEHSQRTAEDYYGRSKSLGELDDDKNLTFRMSIVGPDINENGVGLFNWFMKQSGEVKGFRKAIWSGVTTITLADAVDAALQQKLTGLYHLVNNEKINKYDLLSLFNEQRKAKIQITPDDSYAVDKSMMNTRNDFNFIVPPYPEMVDNMGKWIKEHNSFYPQYIF